MISKKGEHPITHGVYKGSKNQEKKLQESKKSRKDKNVWFRKAANQHVIPFSMNFQHVESTQFKLFLNRLLKKKSVLKINLARIFNFLCYTDRWGWGI